MCMLSRTLVFFWITYLLERNGSSSRTWQSFIGVGFKENGHFGFPESGDSFPAKLCFGRVCLSSRDGPCVPSLALCMPAEWLQCSWGWLNQHLGLFQFRHHHSSFFGIYGNTVVHVHLKRCSRLIQILGPWTLLFFSSPTLIVHVCFSTVLWKMGYAGQFHFRNLNNQK